MKRTKGEWRRGVVDRHLIYPVDDDAARMRLEEGGTTLYPICSVVTGYDEEEDEGNAQLIEKAPVLAEFVALVARMQTSTETDMTCDDAIGTLDELIASSRKILEE